MPEHDIYRASPMLGHSSIKVAADSYLYVRAEKIRANHEAADPLAQIVSRGRKAPVVRFAQALLERRLPSVIQVRGVGFVAHPDILLYGEALSQQFLRARRASVSCRAAG